MKEVLLLLICFWYSSLVSGTCVTYGTCDKDETGSPCVYSGPPKLLDSRMGQETLLEMCGDIFNNPNAPYCCNTEQLMEFKSQMETAGAVGIAKCPACYTNFRNLMCSMICSPVQSEFIKIIKCGKGESGEYHVKEMNYYLSGRFANGTYESCDGVKSLIPSIPLLYFMCGKWTRDCTAERWLKFLGSPPSEGGLSPMKTRHIFVDEPEIIVDGKLMRPMNVRPHKCNDVFGPNNDTCGCSDCPAACQDYYA